MTIKEYIPIFEKTAVYPTTVKNFGLAYLFMGLLEELGELRDIINDNKTKKQKLKIEKELGDCYWYLLGTTIFLKVDFEQMFVKIDWNELEISENLGFFVSDTITLWSNNAGHIKRYYRDNNVDKAQLLLGSIFTITNRLNYICHCLNIPIEQVLATNVGKLTVRKQKNTLHGEGDNR